MKKAVDTLGPVIVGVHVDYRGNHLLFEMVKGDNISLDGERRLPQAGRPSRTVVNGRFRP